jgi:hypothetical protein
MALTPLEIDSLFGIHKVTVFQNGLLIERRARFPMARHKPPKRKGIYEMSRKSKFNLAHIIANCDIKFNSIMTLTYGDYINPIDGKELKRQVNVFLNRFRRRFAVSEYIWFLEFTKRDRPHLHLFSTVNPNYYDRIWLGETWSKISTYDAVRRLLEGNGNTQKLAHSINMFDVLDECQKSFMVHSHPRGWDKIRLEDGATRYALKYAAKSRQKLVPIGFENVGRFWGRSKGVEPKPLAELLIGETMTESGARAILNEWHGHQFELIPRYIFQRDALEFFQKKGLKLTEIFGQFTQPGIDQENGTMV